MGMSSVCQHLLLSLWPFAHPRGGLMWSFILSPTVTRTALLLWSSPVNEKGPGAISKESLKNWPKSRKELR